jgi:hypothetical protein
MDREIPASERTGAENLAALAHVNVKNLITAISDLVASAM